MINYVMHTVITEKLKTYKKIIFHMKFCTTCIGVNIVRKKFFVLLAINNLSTQTCL